MRFDRIFFDSGGTLYGGGTPPDPSPEEVREGRLGRLGSMLAAFGTEVDPAALAGALGRGEAEGRGSHGARFSHLTLVQDVLAELELPLGPERAACLADAYAGPRYASWLYPGTERMLSDLSEAGIGLGIIANTAWCGFSMDRAFAGVGLLSYFSWRVYSCEVGIDKPDERIFRIAEELSGATDRQRLLYVGNSLPADVEGARGAGWRAAMRRSSHDTSGGLADLDFDDCSELVGFVLGS